VTGDNRLPVSMRPVRSIPCCQCWRQTRKERSPKPRSPRRPSGWASACSRRSPTNAATSSSTSVRASSACSASRHRSSVTSASLASFPRGVREQASSAGCTRLTTSTPSRSTAPISTGATGSKLAHGRSGARFTSGWRARRTTRRRGWTGRTTTNSPVHW